MMGRPPAHASSALHAAAAEQSTRYSLTEQNRTRTVSAAVPTPLSDRGSKHSTRTSTWARRDQQQRQHGTSAAAVLARCAYVHLVLDVDVGEADVERRAPSRLKLSASRQADILGAATAVMGPPLPLRSRHLRTSYTAWPCGAAALCALPGT